jgi:dTMP kinase
MSGKQYYGSGLPNLNINELTGKLIVIEGADGSGRSTQMEVITNFLEQRGFAVVNVGLRRSTLVSSELEDAKEGNVLGKQTLSLFYATDFADQLENRIVPALRAGYVVLADRYIYTLMARDRVRGMSVDWLESLYGMAIIPDKVFYLKASPENLVERNFQKHSTLDYWESGMDLGLSQDMFESFLKYQRKIQNEFRLMQDQYDFQVINGNRSRRAVSKELQQQVLDVLEEK